MSEVGYNFVKETLVKGYDTDSSIRNEILSLADAYELAGVSPMVAYTQIVKDISVGIINKLSVKRRTVINGL